ncbi:MAG: hypothetical protein NTW86_02735 [Candidatus Sumerlaeota bacterium]|nr:hypothetical protein [Candidatus Sumerlaeota bacterium]
MRPPFQGNDEGLAREAGLPAQYLHGLRAPRHNNPYRGSRELAAPPEDADLAEGGLLFAPGRSDGRMAPGSAAVCEQWQDALDGKSPGEKKG